MHSYSMIITVIIINSNTLASMCLGLFVCAKLCLRMRMKQQNKIGLKSVSWDSQCGNTIKFVNYGNNVWAQVLMCDGGCFEYCELREQMLMLPAGCVCASICCYCRCYPILLLFWELLCNDNARTSQSNTHFIALWYSSNPRHYTGFNAPPPELYSTLNCAVFSSRSSSAVSVIPFFGTWFMHIAHTLTQFEWNFLADVCIYSYCFLFLIIAFFSSSIHIKYMLEILIMHSNQWMCTNNAMTYNYHKLCTQRNVKCYRI